MPSPIDITSLLTTALAEDIGIGDVTSNATIPAATLARFAMNARGEMVVCGLAFLPELFALVDGSVTLEIMVDEGTKVPAGTTLAVLSGPARALLAGERTALNLVQQLSGVATLTREYVDAVAGTRAKILDTRKTVPGMRAAQKYAVRCGGGSNHRMGLYDAVLIKDNHIAVAGGVAAAVNAAKLCISTHDEAGLSLPPLRGKVGWGGARMEHSIGQPPHPNPLPQGEREYSASRTATATHHGMTIEVECDTLAQLDEALAAGADIVLLDNMSNAQLVEAVAKVDAHNRATGQAVKTEASGNVSLATVRGISETGVDYISVGKLTHSAIAVDIGLDTSA